MNIFFSPCCMGCKPIASLPEVPRKDLACRVVNTPHRFAESGSVSSFNFYEGNKCIKTLTVSKSDGGPARPVESSDSLLLSSSEGSTYFLFANGGLGTTVIVGLGLCFNAGSVTADIALAPISLTRLPSNSTIPF